MQFESALFTLVFVGMACAVIAAVSSLFRPRDLKPHEKLVISSCKRLKKAAMKIYFLPAALGPLRFPNTALTQIGLYRAVTAGMFWSSFHRCRNAPGPQQLCQATHSGPSAPV